MSRTFKNTIVSLGKSIKDTWKKNRKKKLRIRNKLRIRMRRRKNKKNFRFLSGLDPQHWEFREHKEKWFKFFIKNQGAYF